MISIIVCVVLLIIVLLLICRSYRIESFINSAVPGYYYVDNNDPMNYYLSRHTSGMSYDLRGDPPIENKLFFNPWNNSNLF